MERSRPWQLPADDARQLLLNFAQAPGYLETVQATMVDVPTRLDRITCPVLLLQGTADPLVSMQSPRFLSLGRRARIDLAAPPHGGSPDGPAAPDTDGADEHRLTPREREVLALLADGRTNRQIADALFISAKTASVHVSNILAKLGVANRGEAAALAHRLHLTG